MSSILNIAVNGLNNAASRIANAASTIANTGSTIVNSSSTNTTPAVNAGASSSDLTSALVELKADSVLYGANAIVVKTAAKLDKALIDIKT